MKKSISNRDYTRKYNLSKALSFTLVISLLFLAFAAAFGFHNEAANGLAICAGILPIVTKISKPSNFDSMTEEEKLLFKVKEASSENLEKYNQEAENLLKTKFDSDEFKLKAVNDLIAKFNDEFNTKIKSLESIVEEQGHVIAASKTQEKAIKKSLQKQIEEVFEKNLDSNGQVKVTGLDGAAPMEVKFINEDSGLKSKIAVDMTEGSTVTGTGMAHPMFTNYRSDIVKLPQSTNIHFMDFLNLVTITAGKIRTFLRETLETDGSGNVVEGSAAGQSSILLVDHSVNVLEIGTFFNYSRILLSDYKALASRIAQRAVNNILNKIDQWITATTSGNGTTAFYSLFSTENATAFVPGTFSQSVVDGNLIDLLSTMKLQAELTDFVPNFCVLTSTQIKSIKGLKDKNDNSILDRRVVFGAFGEPTYIDGLRIIRNNKMGADACVIGDSNQMDVCLRESMFIENGYTGDDFKEGNITTKASVRMSFGTLSPLAFIFSKKTAADIASITINS